MVPRRKSPFQSPEKLDQAAEKVYRAADAAGVPVALIGGFAMQFYNSPRLTGDVDFVSGSKFSVGDFQARLAIGGERRMVDGIEVDIIRREDKYRVLYEEALDRAERVEDVLYPIVAPEYLVAMKMQSSRGKDKLETFKQMAQWEKIKSMGETEE